MSLRKFISPIEAQFVANELESNNIRYQLFGQATREVLSFYGAMVKTDLHVLSDDLEHAKAVLAGILESGRDDLEPIEAEDAATVLELPDEQDHPVRWVTVRACESVATMRETAMALEAARLDVHVPPLAPRGAAPPGQGARFIVRVREDDADRAAALLSRAAAEADEEEPHCPKCGNWNVFDITHELKNLVLGLVGRRMPPQCECLKCHYIGDRSEFVVTTET